MTPQLRAAAALAPVGLEELVARAARQTRIDRKYVLPLAAADRLVAELGRTGGARVLDSAGARDFGYASLYLDTPDLAGYHLAARGRRRRFKVRRRTYLDSGDAYVEVKTRGARGTTVKQRVPDDGDAAGFVEAALAAAGHGAVRSHHLSPVLHTAYRRTTLLLPATDDRVTVDTELTWWLPGAAALTLPGLAVVETKTGSGVSAADRLLWRSGHRPARVSKYGTGLAALRGDLPDNRWWPVLRRHFTALTPCTSSCPADDRIPA
ncbi:polyphosphate polymerase domain-containing protein [Trujillonella endophytica]|uniref:VTC domain-containing protein n=1 Tax=Trujillonella endophytica TaxID=673521 RepID=A0A1H8W6G9_9ACTN|nr:polyphosphate polymerase domain-containing protein [Trujillella endophytica]SEP23251.1 VTC domain-containing protein [Trujillella endophytica]